MSQAFEIDAMQRRDWARVRAIYQEGLAGGLAAFRLDAPLWQAWDAGHLAPGRLVARGDATILGWAALSPVADT